METSITNVIKELEDSLLADEEDTKKLEIQISTLQNEISLKRKRRDKLEAKITIMKYAQEEDTGSLKNTVQKLKTPVFPLIPGGKKLKPLIPQDDKENHKVTTPAFDDTYTVGSIPWTEAESMLEELADHAHEADAHADDAQADDEAYSSEEEFTKETKSKPFKYTYEAAFKDNMKRKNAKVTIKKREDGKYDVNMKGTVCKFTLFNSEKNIFETNYGSNLKLPMASLEGTVDSIKRNTPDKRMEKCPFCEVSFQTCEYAVMLPDGMFHPHCVVIMAKHSLL